MLAIFSLKLFMYEEDKGLATLTIIIIHGDGKCPDGMTQSPCHSGKLLVWDMTVVSTTAESYITAAARIEARWQKLQPPGNAKNILSSPRCTHSLQLPWTF